MTDQTVERIFQDDIIRQLLAHGWQLGTPDKYNRELALYEEDVLGFVQETQDAQWQKFCANHPKEPGRKFLELVAAQLAKADPNATHKESRSFGTLGVLRHELRDRNARFNLCQFKPEHDLNPDTLAKYQKNRLRVVPELVYSPWARSEQIAETGSKAKAWRIDLVLFVNGLPVATLELKSEFKQSVDRAIKQYKTTRLPVDPVAKKPEPLLTFKRGALVHFAVSQYQVYMATRLEGANTFFLPFNKGTKDGGAGNDVPADVNEYATAYLWNEVLLPDNLLNILARFVHLQIEEKEDALGKKYKKESLIFPRYHQWNVVNKLLDAARTEGPGQRYLIQHSAGSGKSNSIAWVAHQLSSLYKADGQKQFHSVIVVTDRTVLDAQLQDTIYQFEHTDGVVGRINNKEGEGSKSEKLAGALEVAQPIIIVTIQTFPFVLRAIENSVSLKERCYAIIADEAHSSQSGSTARQLKEVLMKEAGEEEELDSDDIIAATVASRRASGNLSFFAFTATPKPKTLELFGRLPKPDEVASSTNKPEAFHVYSMRQAIEEGFILDVLKNYTSYKVAYKLALKIAEADEEVESKRAKVKLNQWVRLHDHNIAQKVMLIVEHFKDNVMGLLGGQAKAMVVTSSRKEAVRYKQCFDKYIADKGYQKIHAMVAFSGEVEFGEQDPNSAGLTGQKFTETSMNPGLKGRDMRKAFDTDDYQVMIVANKFQTGFDQPRLVGMYIDKKIANDVEIVQTLSRLNRTAPGKDEIFIIDFVNDPANIRRAFSIYDEGAVIDDVQDLNVVYEIKESLDAQGIYETEDLENFKQARFKTIRDITQAQEPQHKALFTATDRPTRLFNQRLKMMRDAAATWESAYEKARHSPGDKAGMQSADHHRRDYAEQIANLMTFKSGLGRFCRTYSYVSQLIDFGDPELENFAAFAKLLQKRINGEPLETVDLKGLVLTGFDIKAKMDMIPEETDKPSLKPVGPGGCVGCDDPNYLREIIERLNRLFGDATPIRDQAIFVNHIVAIAKENDVVMAQVENNAREQALKGNLPGAVQQGVVRALSSHQKLATLVLKSDRQAMSALTDVIYDLIHDHSTIDVDKIDA